MDKRDEKAGGAVSKNQTLRFPLQTAAVRARRCSGPRLGACAARAAHGRRSSPGGPRTPGRLPPRPPRREGASRQAGRRSERCRASPREVSGTHGSAATLAP